MAEQKKIIIEWLGEGTGTPDFKIPINVELEVIALHVNFLSTDLTQRHLFYWTPKEGFFVEFQQRNSHFKNTFITYWGKVENLSDVIEKIQSHGSYYDIQDILGLEYCDQMCFADIEYD